MTFLTANFLYFLTAVAVFGILFMVFAIRKGKTHMGNFGGGEVGMALNFKDVSDRIDNAHRTMFKDVWQIALCGLLGGISFILFVIGFIGWIVSQTVSAGV